MKFKFKLKKDNLYPKSEVLKKPFLFAGKAYASAALFLANVRKSYILMTKEERIVAISLFSVAFILLGYKTYQGYIATTVSAPDRGGEYSEVMLGDVKFLNPVAAQSDAEKSVSKLLFQGLVKVTDPVTVIPDAAETYSISTDGLQYTFNLRRGLTFSDGQPLKAADVAYTIGLMQSPDLKSSLLTTWSGVEVNVIDDFTIEFNLAKAYGPFIYNCDFGIVPSYLSADAFSKDLIGSGPFQFDKSVKADGRITEVLLERNESYSGGSPYLNRVRLTFKSNPTEVIDRFRAGGKTKAVFGADPGEKSKLDYSSSRRLGLIYNIRRDALKDVAIRTKIATGAMFETPPELTLISLDAPNQRNKAAELEERFAAQNLKVKISYLNSVDFSDKVASKDYDLILYGFDFGYDRDPYIFWHSSQVAELNLSGWSDKAADILMEDARMLPDAKARNDKYDAVFGTIQTNYLAEFYDPIRFSFSVNPEIKGIESITGTQVYSRFDTIEKWYIEEKRVRKE